MKNKELGIYIHIPFCKHKCYYCDFISYCNKDKLIDKYIDAVKKEIKIYFENEELLKEYDITTIYIGGGTPSYIDSKYIVDILNLIKSKLEKANITKIKDIEITIELNPGTVNKEKLMDYKKANINRLSIGLQSTNDDILKQIGRIHNYEEFKQNYGLARAVGFDNINVDLMIGLPNQSIEDVKNSLKNIINLEPEHISVYSLILEEGTTLEKLINEKKLELVDEETERQMYWLVKDILELNRYNHYEISNFCKDGKQSKHNINCWEQKEYIGIGAGAHSYLKNVRYANTSKLEKYIEIYSKLNRNKKENIEFYNNINKELENNIEIEEIQDVEEQKKEYMLLGLRKTKGVEISKFKEKYIDNPIFIYREILEKLVNEKLLIIDGNNIRLTNKGLDFANLVWEEFV